MPEPTGLTTATAEEQYTEYLHRLQVYLSYLYQTGKIQKADVKDIYNRALSARNTIYGEVGAFWNRRVGFLERQFQTLSANLPHYEEVMGTEKKPIQVWDWRLKQYEWQQGISKYKKELYQKEMLKSEYLHQAELYSNWVRGKGGITPQQQQMALAEISKQIDMGIDASSLSWANQIKDFQKFVVNEVKRIDAENEQNEAWNTWLSNQKETAVANAIAYEQKPTANSAMQREQARQAELASLDPNRGWIRKWQLEHIDEVSEPEAANEVNRLENEVTRLDELSQFYPNNPQVQDASQYARQNLATWKEKLGVEEATGRGIPVVTSDLPPTPKWLAGITGLSEGAPIQKGVQTTIPSMQQWNRLLPSEQQKYAGFLDWRGVNTEDIWAKMGKMQVQNPYGAGRPRWTPAGVR